MTMQIFTTRAGLRQALGDAHPGLVPTMGALHDGHVSLITRSAHENDLTVVSIFVNPTQFANRADLDRYPRNLDHDATAAASAGADVIFAPDAAEVYPAGFDTIVEVGSLSDVWEGAARPGHFRGVATVVTILLNLVQPARAYFGEKDYQQLQIVRQFHRDLALPGEIIGCPTIRGQDGLALSSRNVRLSAHERTLAAAIPRAFAAAQSAAREGESDVHALEELARAQLNEPAIAIDYVAVVDGDSLLPMQRVIPGARILIAVDIGGVRLIDNAAIDPLDAQAT